MRHVFFIGFVGRRVTQPPYLCAYCGSGFIARARQLQTSVNPSAAREYIMRELFRPFCTRIIDSAQAQEIKITRAGSTTLGGGDRTWPAFKVEVTLSEKTNVQ